MKLCTRARAIFASGLAMVLVLPLAASGRADEKPAFEMHQWGVWLTYAGTKSLNSREEFPSSVPWLPVTTRPRTLPNEQLAPSPLNLLTFYGKPQSKLAVTVTIDDGTLLGSWPQVNKTVARVKWAEMALLARTDGKLPGAVELPANWFTPSRADDALVARNPEGRGERFLSFDFEANYSLPLKVEGGPENYTVHYDGNQPIYDVVIVVPSPKGTRVGWLDELKFNTKGVPLKLSGALPAGAELKALTQDALTARLTKTGLNRHEVDFLVSRYQAAIFAGNTLTATFRLSPWTVSERTSIVVEPKPARSVHVVLVIARDVDHNRLLDTATLIQLLGSSKYKEREFAEQRLLGMRSTAVVALREAMSSSDPEVAYRAERVLTQLQGPSATRVNQSR